MRICGLLLAMLSPAHADFYVSPQGSDTNPGTRARPFASLTRARDAVREAKRREPDRDYRVYLRGGTYRLARTVVFSLEDSATEGRSIVYAAYGDETPLFSSGRQISGWTREGKIWAASLPPDFGSFRTLYDRRGRLPRSSGKPFSPVTDYRDAPNLDRFTLRFPKGGLKQWPNMEDIELRIRPNYGWVLNLLPLASVDESSGAAFTRIPASYPMVKVRWGPADINANGTVWVENALEDINEPGEWAVNTRQRKLYLWPREGTEPDGIEAPALTELLRVEGEVDFDDPSDKPVRGIVFRGLGFCRADRFAWERDRIGSTLQHDWEMFDRPTALVRLRAAERISFEKCRWFDSGGAGIRMDLHAQSNRVADSVIEHLGGAGIVLAGYGPGTKDVNRRNEIVRNHIHDVGEILWHAAAISVWQSGENRIAHNLVHDVNYTAVTVSGRISWNREGRGDGWKTIRWKEVEQTSGKDAMPAPGKIVPWRARERFLHGRNNLVERNEIHDVMKQLWDGDAIYVSGTGRGNRIRENFIHDCLSENMCEGIRCDDDQHETIIERNVILRTGGMGTGIAIKGSNHVLNNFIIDPRQTFHHRGVISIEGIPVDGARIQRNVLFVKTSGLRPFYLKNLLGPPDPRFNETETDYNLYWHASDEHWADAHLLAARADAAELHSATGDPLFKDPERGDFRFKPGSPALKLGIEPIDLRNTGLRKWRGRG